MSTFLLLQLADAAFPSGGYAHSGGLEACAALSATELEDFFDQTLHTTARGALPFVRDAHAAPEALAAIDALADATITSHVANRASRAQGRSLATNAARMFASVTSLGAHAKTHPTHHAPVFGALFGHLGLSQADALTAYLHGVARGVLSSAVRLGLVGPLEAQRIHASRGPRLEALVEDVPAAAAQTAPLLELYGALHDELDGRLFQS